MAAIRGKHTAPEIKVRRELFRRGFRFRVHDRSLPGSPDVVLRRYNAVILVNGCFWHGHSCGTVSLPATNTSFWKAKIARNRARDMKVRRALRRMGKRVATVWECALVTKGRGDSALQRMGARLEGWLKGKLGSLTLAKQPRSRHPGGLLR
jgi:DNA mismatch endonuclease (patch repair protein)